MARGEATGWWLENAGSHVPAVLGPSLAVNYMQSIVPLEPGFSREEGEDSVWTRV